MFERRSEHKRDETLEALLKEVNGLLGAAESEAVRRFETTRYPAVLIMGSPRSGTTLLLQWLARTDRFAYPTNILSRFYGAPYIGAKIQLMLTRHDFRNEIFDFNEEVPFASRLGKTRGALAPNEFWYFWRRFFPYGELQCLDERELERVDRRGFVSELAAIEAVFDKPFAMKGMFVNWNIPFISSMLPKVLFLYIKRHPFFNIQSLLEARVDYYGDKRAWYSFKPPEYITLRGLSPYEQVAGQIYHTNRAVEDGLGHVEAPKRLEISYEEFCSRPEAVYSDISDKLSLQGCEIDRRYEGPERFAATNDIRLPLEECEKIREAYIKISGKDIKAW